MPPIDGVEPPRPRQVQAVVCLSQEVRSYPLYQGGFV